MDAFDTFVRDLFADTHDVKVMIQYYLCTYWQYVCSGRHTYCMSYVCTSNTKIPFCVCTYIGTNVLYVCVYTYICSVDK